MKTFKNIHEIKLMKHKLKLQEHLSERDLSSSASAIVENLTDRIKDLAFDLGSRIVLQIFSGFRKRDSGNG